MGLSLNDVGDPARWRFCCRQSLDPGSPG